MTTIAVPEPTKEQNILAQMAMAVLEKARMIEVETGEDFEFATGKIVEWKSAIKSIEAEYKDMKAAAHNAHKTITTRESNAIKPVKEAIGIVEKRALDWKRAEDARMAAAAAEIAAWERARIEAERLAEAVELEAEGLGHMAEAIMAAPIEAPKVVMPAVQATGMGTAKRWKFEIVDASKVNPDYLVPDMKAIQKAVEGFADKDKAERVIGGIRVYQDERFRLNR